jgi:hypothetical protein
MIFNCRRCGERGELRKGKVTGNNVVKYRQHEVEINSSLIVKLENTPRKRLCPSCMEELSMWIANKEAHVRVPNSSMPVVSTAPKSKACVGHQ